MSSTYIPGNLYLDETFLSDKSMVLKHHPDKRKARGLKVGDGEDDYFTCITRGNDGAGLHWFILVLICFNKAWVNEIMQTF